MSKVAEAFRRPSVLIGTPAKAIFGTRSSHSPESESSVALFRASSAFCCQTASLDSVLQTKS